MKSLIAVLSVLLLALPGCLVHHHPHGHGKHPHGAPPGQVKKLYRCGHCHATSEVALKCHGKVMIVID